jgi:hypothetical protein
MFFRFFIFGEVMKTKSWLVLSFLSLAGLLSGCATTSVQSTSANIVQENLSKQDQAQLNAMMNTANDGESSAWHNTAGNTAFELTTHDTHVNAQGLPCRNYVLVIDRDYHRKITVNALSCRDNGEWKDQG